MAYSCVMGEQWLEIEDGGETRRVPLAGSLTRIGGASPEVSMAGLPPGEVHVWSEPPKVVLVAGTARLAVNGVEGREGLLADGDQIEWGDTRIRFRREASAAVLEEIPVEAPPPVQSGPAPSDGGAAWVRVRAGMYVDLGLSDKATVKGWQDSVMRGDFAPEACARDLSAGVDLDGDDPRLVERSGRLLRDFLMSSTMSGVGGVRRRARQAGKKGAAILISQLVVLAVYTLIILVVMFLLHAKWPELFFDPLFDKAFNQR